MTDTDRLRAMIDELRRMREQCEPKSKRNQRYLRYSNAVSALRWIIDDLAAEHETSWIAPSDRLAAPYHRRHDRTFVCHRHARWTVVRRQRLLYSCAVTEMDLSSSRLLECLAADVDRLGGLAAGNSAVAVPTCPGWLIDDLVRHVAQGLIDVAQRHLRWSGPPPEPDLAAEEPIAALRRCHAAFVDAVGKYAMDASAEAGARFWLRRMTHEIAVHRVDGERAIGQPMGPIPPDLAIDGVAEALSVFLDRETHAWREDYEDDLTDWGDRWLLVSVGAAGWRVVVRPEGVEVEPAIVGGADAVVRAEPVAALLWLYGRGDDVAVEGDDALVAQVRRLLAKAMG